MRDDVFVVAMLNVLREPFEAWLAERYLTMGEMPEPDIGLPLYVVVPDPSIWDARRGDSPHTTPA